MENFLVWIIVLIVAVAIIYALLQWSKIPIDPVVYRVAGLLIVGIILVLLITFLWPILTTGKLPAIK